MPITITLRELGKDPVRKEIESGDTIEVLFRNMSKTTEGKNFSISSVDGEVSTVTPDYILQDFDILRVSAKSEQA